MTYILDIDEVRSLDSKLPVTTQGFREQFTDVQAAVFERFGIRIPEHLRRWSRDMYQSVKPSTPYVLEFIVNIIINDAGRTNESIVIKNPQGLYNLCVGLGAGEFMLKTVVVEGDVGTFYGGISSAKDISHHIKGCAGRSFMDNAQLGKIIVEGKADDSAAQVNHGAYFLFKDTVGPRLGWGQRGGGIVTLVNLPFNSGLFMSGGNIVALGNHVEQEIAPDMQEGRIYLPTACPKMLGIGAACMPVGVEDYARIADALAPFTKELDIIGKLGSHNPVLQINGESYDFSKYVKILPKRLAN